MPVQLIVYPQNYEGESNPLLTSQQEFMVDGINFTTINSATTTDDTSSNLGYPYEVLIATPPADVNTWYRYRYSSTGSYPVQPVEVSNNLQLHIDTTSSNVLGNGVYQRLSNLIIGQVYTFTIELVTPSPLGVMINVGIWEAIPSPVETYTTDLLPLSSTVSGSFTATATDNTINLFLSNPISSAITLTITSISIQGQGITPTVQHLGEGQVICDLYEDEDIPLTLSVDNFKNVAEKVQSYSKAFNLPATKRNNLIFDNMFEITRSWNGTTFNPYIKTQCVLKQDGFILFQGYLRMIDVTDKDGEISYNVNLYSEVVALADILKDKTFSELGFTELEHDYNKTNIKYSWNDSPDTSITYLNPSTSGYRDAYTTLRYPFVDWNHQMLVAGTTGTSAVAGYPELVNLEQVFRPFIQLKYLINRIFEETPFTWESTFFDTPEFEKLYMDFNWGDSGAPVDFDTTGRGDITSNSLIQGSYATFISTSSSFSSEAGYSAGVFTAVNDNTEYFIDYMLYIYFPSGGAYQARWVRTPTSGTPEIIDAVGQTVSGSGLSINFYSSSFTRILNTGDTLKLQIKKSAGTGFVIASNSTRIICTVKGETASTNSIGQTLRGELGQWEFLKGILTMFNLVSLPDEDNPNNIKFETYADVFNTNTSSGDMSDLTLASRSIQHDWTDKIDVSQMKLTPLTDLNKNTIFKFVEDDDDFAFTNYKKQVGGHLYGSQLYDASQASNGLSTVLQGTKEIIAEPFAATVIKPLMSQYSGIVVPAIYAMSDDGTEGFDNSPRIMFNNGIKDSGITYYIPEQNGLASENQENYLQFSHLTLITPLPTTSVAIPNDFNFGECQLLPPIGNSTPKNLYNLYWSDYYNELYNPDTRIMTIKVNLNAADINRFKFNDTVMIKNREFRVNKIDYKPNDLATVEFILIP